MIGLMIGLSIALAAEREYTAEVARVIDGDTVEVIIDAYEGRISFRDTIRVHGIDAPPADTDAGKASRAEAAKILSGHETVTVTAWGDRDGGMTVGRIQAAGVDFGDWMVSRGHAETVRRRQPVHDARRARRPAGVLRRRGRGPGRRPDGVRHVVVVPTFEERTAARRSGLHVPEHPRDPRSQLRGDRERPRGVVGSGP